MAMFVQELGLWALILVTQLRELASMLPISTLVTMEMPALMMMCVVMECVLVLLLYVTMETFVPVIFWEWIFATQLQDSVSIQPIPTLVMT